MDPIQIVLDLFPTVALSAAGYVAYTEIHAELETNREVRIIKAAALSKADVGSGGSLISRGIDPATNMLKFHYQPPPLPDIVLSSDSPANETPINANGKQIGTAGGDHPFRADALALVDASIAAKGKHFGPRGNRLLGTSNPACPFASQTDRWMNAVHGYLATYGVMTNSTGTWAARSSYAPLARLHEAIVKREVQVPYPDGG